MHVFMCYELNLQEKTYRFLGRFHDGCFEKSYSLDKDCIMFSLLCSKIFVIIAVRYFKNYQDCTTK